MWEGQVRYITGKELDNIYTNCPYIDAIKRHKQRLGVIEGYTQWLKGESRASYFFLFRLCTHVHNTFFPKKQQLPFTSGGTRCSEPDVTLRDLALSPGYHNDYAPQPIPEMNSSAVVPPTNENTSPPENTPDSTPAGGNTGQAGKTRNSGLIPIPEKRSGISPEHLRLATGFPPQPKIVGPKGESVHTVRPGKIYREVVRFCSGCLRESGPEATRTAINSIFCEWASIFNDCSSPFSWVDSRDSEQCDWLWNAMRVRCMGTPLSPLTPEQKYWFACTTFDNWEGWNEQQVQLLLESNSRRNGAKFTQAPFQAPRVRHKAILFDELKSTREQQKRCDRRADGSVPLGLPGGIYKQPESIARSRGVLPKRLLNEIIRQVYQDFVADEQHKTLS